MLGTVATCTLITVELAVTAYSLHRAGVFTDLKNKFKKQVKRTYQAQPSLKELVWKCSYTH